MSHILSQMRPPKPIFTEKECPDQSRKVFIITGGYVGIGLELAKILYQKNARIYLAGRSAKKGSTAVQQLKAAFPASKGHLEFLDLDLADLTTIKTAAKNFLAAESRLDIIWNNAGVMIPPAGSKTKQGYELQLGTNCLGPFLFTVLLLPILRKTSQSSPPGSVRVLFAASLAAETSMPKGCICFEDINYEKSGGPQEAYGQSKVGNILLGAEFAARGMDAGDGIIFASFNPGNLKTELQRHVTGILGLVLPFILYKPIYGAYTELFAGLSPALDIKLTGSYILPWGRIVQPRKEIAEGMKRKEVGGTGIAQRFWLWCEEETYKYM